MSENGATRANTDGQSPWPLNRRDYSERLRLSMASDTGALNDSVDALMRIARRCECVDDNGADLEIAIREALANAMIHGNNKDLAKRVFVRCYGSPGTGLLILVRDEGPGFRPESVPDPRSPDRMHLHHGRGLLLMRELMDYVEFRKDGREVVLYYAC